MGRLKLRRKPGGHRGPTPTEPRLWCDWVLEKRPSPQWEADHQSELTAGTLQLSDCPDDQMVLGANLYGYYAKPSGKLPPNLWPQGRVLLLTAQEYEYDKFRAEAEQDIERQQQEPDGDHKEELAEVAELARKAAKKGRNGGKPSTTAGGVLPGSLPVNDGGEEGAGATNGQGVDRAPAPDESGVAK